MPCRFLIVALLFIFVPLAKAAVIPPTENFPLPTVDLSGPAEAAARHVTIARGTTEVYQGHPTTVLLPDGKTIYCVWTINHGGPCGPMKRSDDGGLTWSGLLPVPENWKSTKNCPSIYRLVDPRGKARLVVFAQENGVMRRAYSEDDGKTWSPMQPAGDGIVPSVMPFTDVKPVDGGKRLLAMTNIRRPGETREKYSNVLAQSFSTDGGLTWSPLEIVRDIPGLRLCEPEIVRSPDGKQLLCLIREDAKHESLFMTSDDEGRTWSKERTLPKALWGDRHKAKYTPDGRLVVVFRDVGRKTSPSNNHFVAWVGSYDDIVNVREAGYRVKLIHNHRRGKIFSGRLMDDCGYPGLEVLPDGTLVATTYAKYTEGDEGNYVVAVRFTLKETDAALVLRETQNTPPIPNRSAR
ncbi:sialidase family protein [Ereboglobus luteus]|uniref:sialidase family protein n=1 Tax=Ereboglobus luteus TaxID=1796921 RepID=UPI000D54C13E|nr:sialidase family protein [Ereboglobus luteus]